MYIARLRRGFPAFLVVKMRSEYQIPVLQVYSFADITIVTLNSIKDGIVVFDSVKIQPAIVCTHSC